MSVCMVPLVPSLVCMQAFYIYQDIERGNILYMYIRMHVGTLHESLHMVLHVYMYVHQYIYSCTYIYTLYMELSLPV